MRWLLAGVVLLGAASLGLFGYSISSASRPLTWQFALLVGAWLISTAAVWHFLCHLPQGELDFDGENWYFADRLGTASIRFDGQNCLLLRFEDDLKNADWLWVEARSDSNHGLSHWHDLRRAVYSRPALQNLPTLI